MWFNIILIHPLSSQHQRASLLLQMCLCLALPNSSMLGPSPHSPYSLRSAQLFGGLLQKEKMDVSGQEKVWIRQRQLLCLGTCPRSSWVWGCAAGN